MKIIELNKNKSISSHALQKAIKNILGCANYKGKTKSLKQMQKGIEKGAKQQK